VFFGTLLGFIGVRPLAADTLATWSVRLSTPQVASASVGLLLGEIDPPPDFKGESHLPHGLLMQVEPGCGGGKLSLGYAKGLLPHAGGGVKLSLLRTWGKPWFTDPRQTYLGVEADASFFVKLSLGILVRVNKDEHAPGFLLTGDIGLGF
jgi:hypothetical protein